ncbi:MAG TPA: PQQ-binding-like beta-propeller repeat protein [Terriglobia bacterium]|nr:PQQ-binding-like beta-propeller repeat protein [Terriglobia bacterium]
MTRPDYQDDNSAERREAGLAEPTSWSGSASRPATALRAALIGLAGVLALAACDKTKVPLPGERVSVLSLDRTLDADSSLADVQVRLPKPYVNSDWPQVGGNQTHAMYHLEAAGDQALHEVWSADIGSSADSSNKLLAEPVIADGIAYAMDADSRVSAINATNGNRLWQVDLTPDDEDDSLFGGGVAVAEGKVIVTTPFARVFALDAKSGKKVWEAPAPAALRSPPAVSDGRVFVVTLDNQLVVYALDDGRRLWSNAGVEEAAGLLGGATPAVQGNVVVAAYTSGDLLAFDVIAGRSLWSDNLAGKTRGDATATLTDIRGRPVIDRDLLIAVSNGGVMTAINVKRGGRLWDASIGGTQSPWVAGDFVYVLTSQSEVICLQRQDGRIKWVQNLPRFEDPETHKSPIYWSGPVLVSDRLLVTGSEGHAVAISPYTGKILGQMELPAPTHLPPVVANQTVYILSDDAELIALR